MAPSRTDRRSTVAKTLRKQRTAERRRGYVLIGSCGLVAVLIIAAAAYRPVRNWYDLRSYSGDGLAAIGSPASACRAVRAVKATGYQSVEPQGTTITYDHAPPAFGAHWSDAAPFGTTFYDAASSPDIESLVQNLEYGYTILWYDATAAGDPETVNAIKAIAAKFAHPAGNYREKFIAAPWTAADAKASGAFPSGEHVALTHWSAGGEGNTTQAKQKGVFQYCTGPSGAALETFMEKYPYLDSPTPGSV